MTEEFPRRTAPVPVPGTLSLPREPGPRAAVVLLGGSGPVDRDETIGRNRPFKDLAWGLASSGVAVLRFDKVTCAHGSQVAQDREFTVTDEYVPHAVAAVRLLRQHPAVDAGRVFVLGHSLGGTVAPRVAAGEPSVAGLVIMAGGTQPLHRAAVRQVRYIASLDPATAAASQAVIVQGGRDYQATVADDLAGWRAGLARRPDVTIRVYDPDDHLFFTGTGPSAPAEYEPEQHMDPAVVADIASWLAPA